LKNPNHSSDLNIIRDAISDIVSRYRRKLLPSHEGSFDRGVRLPKFPSYIWVDLYREDGSLRWLESGGWFSGNIVAVAEWISGKKTPVVIHKPEENYKGIRIRYSINVERVAEAYAELYKMINELNLGNKMDA
jgi:hypothetical protein